jgi:hypothetical protein
MFIKPTLAQTIAINSPLKHADHARPKTRREFVSQGFMAGSASVFGSSLFSLFGSPSTASAALSSDLEALKDSCGISAQGAGKVPFICFDLAGGANISGSNVLVGGRGGQMDFLSTAGYSKLGLPGDMVPNAVNPDDMTSSFINEEFGLAFHSDSGFLRGIMASTTAETRALTNGVVIPARSDNDSGNNPHNPMYGIYGAGAKGSLLDLIGSRSSDSGGNSMSPMDMINPEVRPTKVDRPSDVTGLVDVGDLVGLLSQEDAVAVMESIQRISDSKMNSVNTEITKDEVVKDLVRCGYVKSADIADRFGDPASLNPAEDSVIVGPAGIFSQAEFDGDGEFRKTASVMKLVANGYAGAGTITMGGYDYHTGNRSTGELRDERAGRCIGACLEYAAKLGTEDDSPPTPIMIYVFSDGSVASNGMIDNSVNGRGKGVWTGDNSSTAAAFYLVYNPTGKPVARTNNQIGYMRADASVETSSSPAANNVNQLVQTVLLNYMALHGEQGDFASKFPNHGLGNTTLQDSLIGLETL